MTKEFKFGLTVYLEGEDDSVVYAFLEQIKAQYTWQIYLEEPIFEKKPKNDDDYEWIEVE